MRRHLYENKKPCASISGIILNDNIKEHVMLYRLYKQEEHTPNVVNINTINNIQVNNVLNSIPLQDKLYRFTKYQDVTTIDYQTKVQELFEDTTNKLEFCEEYNDIIFELRDDDFLDIIDKTCHVNMESFEDFSIFYNSDLDYITLFDNGEWKNLIHKRGIREMIAIIQAAYLNVYEKYLIRRTKYTQNLRVRQRCEELLLDYYKFISLFDLDPYVTGKCDDDILDNGKYDSYMEAEKFYEKYNSLKRSIRVSQQRYLVTSILKIIHKHSKNNVSKLHNTIASAIANDNKLLNCLQTA